MEKADTLVGDCLPALNSPLEPSARQSTTAREDMAAQIVTMLRVNYPGAFERAYPTAEMVELAKIAYMDQLAGLTPAQVRKGLDKAKRREYMPKPSELAKDCFPRGEDMGLPSEAEALRQATGSSTQKHPAVSFTLRNMGDDVFALRRADSKTAAAMFGPHWAATIKHVMSGGELPEPELEIEHKHQRADKETGNAILAEMKAL